MKFTALLIAHFFPFLVMARPGPMKSAVHPVSNPPALSTPSSPTHAESTPIEPVVTWAEDNIYTTKSRRRLRAKWEKIVCKGLIEAGCSSGIIQGAGHKSTAGGFDVPHVTVYRSDGKMMHAFKNGTFTEKDPTKPFIPVSRRKHEALLRSRLIELFQQGAVKMTSADPTGQLGYTKMTVGRVPVPYPIPRSLFLEKVRTRPHRADWSELPELWKLPEEHEHLALHETGQGTRNVDLGAHKMMVGSMEVPLHPR